MMPAETAAMDLRRRRLALGISLNTMAQGTGLRLPVVTAIEDGVACEKHNDHYASWLAVLERYPHDRREGEITQAMKGRRFETG